MPIVRAISKYGEINFKFRVIEECTEESVNERENITSENITLLTVLGITVPMVEMV